MCQGDEGRPRVTQPQRGQPDVSGGGQSLLPESQEEGGDDQSEPRSQSDNCRHPAPLSGARGGASGGSGVKEDRAGER